MYQADYVKIHWANCTLPTIKRPRLDIDQPFTADVQAKRLNRGGGRAETALIVEESESGHETRMFKG